MLTTDNKMDKAKKKKTHKKQQQQKPKNTEYL